MSGSALEGGAVFEREGQAAIRVSRGVVQQTAPELLVEGGDLAVLLFQNPEESGLRGVPGLHIADPIAVLAVFLLGGVKALAQVVEAFLVLGLIERDRVVLPDVFFHHSGK